MRGKIFIYFIMFWTALDPNLIWACSDLKCDGQYEIISSKYHRIGTIFIGQVTHIDRNEGFNDVEFKVIKVYKGQVEQGDYVNVDSGCVGSDPAVCGYEFLKGKEYLVYAYGIISNPGDVYYVDLCEGAKEISCAYDDIAHLEQLIGFSAEQ